MSSKAREEKLAEAHRAQAELIRRQRELDDAKREIDLTVEKKGPSFADHGAGQSTTGGGRGAEATLGREGRADCVDAAPSRRAEAESRTGFPAIAGRVQELALEATLRAKFPRDLIEPVPKGEFGGKLAMTDLLLRQANVSHGGGDSIPPPRDQPGPCSANQVGPPSFPRWP